MALFGFEDSPVEALAAALTDGSFALGRLQPSERPSSAAADLFRQRTSEICESVAALSSMAREGSRSFVLVGAAAKAITVLQASGITFDAVIDEAPLKVGRYVPGTNLRIQPFSDVSAIDAPCLFLIGAWNFRAEIERKLQALRTAGGDLSAVYFPSLLLSQLSGASEPN
ncbi:hypothetical protein JNW90_12035 [Micromonospora sp. STR1s_5]|nr:hypothetical protein [Micromonospora sp. STR1s_5]